MANYYTITANFFGSQPIIEHLTTLMENFDRLPDLSNINADEDWLPLIIDNKTLEQFDDDDYSLGVFSEGYSSEDDGSITLFARGCNEPGLDLCTKICEALGLGCKFRSTDECDEDRYDELIPVVEDPDGSLALRPLSELNVGDEKEEIS